MFLKDLYLALMGPIGSKLQLEALVDNRSVEVNLISTSSVDDKRLRRDLNMIEEMIDREEVDSIQWVDGKQQLADALTKKGVNAMKLLSVIHGSFA